MGFAKIKSISKADFLLGPIFDFDRPSTPTGLVEQNAAGAQWATPTGIERGISALDRIPVSIETRGGTSSTNL